MKGINPGETKAIEFSTDIDTPSRWQDNDGIWHKGLAATTFDAWSDEWDMICKEQSKAQDKLLFDEMKDKGQIIEPVLICNRKVRDQIESAIPGRFCILASELCEGDKVYIVADREIADNIRQNLNWMEGSQNDQTRSGIEPCEDAISRQAVEALLAKYSVRRPGWYTFGYQMTKELKDLPSVTPKQKMGHWIEKDGFDGDTYYDCSECGESWTTIEGTPWDNEIKYCPNCGARMVEPQESEDKE